MPKTGSTSIQASLFNWKQDDTCCYLSGGKPNPSGPLALAFSPRTDWPPVLRLYSESDGFELGRSFVRQLEAQLDSGHQRYIFSSEYLTWKRFPAQGVRRFLDWAKTQVGSIKAVGYVRDPKSYMESLFQQWLKQDAFSEKAISFDLDRFYPDYCRSFSVLEDVLGAENVSYWPFDRRQLMNGCVVTDFANRLGLNIPARHRASKNVSLSAGAVSLLYAYNKARPRGRAVHIDSGVNERLLAALADIGRGRLHFSPSLVDPILERNADDLEWMESRLGERFKPQCRDDGFEVRDEIDLLDLARETLEEVHAHKNRSWDHSAVEIGSPHGLIAHMIGIFANDEIGWLTRAQRDRRPIFVWGAGSAGLRLLSKLQSHQFEVAGIVDSDASKQGRTTNGIVIISPDALLITQHDDRQPRPAILIASTYHDEISKLLERSGFEEDQDWRVSGTSGIWI
jgi:hypothetical protein